jgi:Domain of unknown function (DUF4375)
MDMNTIVKCISLLIIVSSCSEQTATEKEEYITGSSVIAVPDPSFYHYNPLTQPRPVINLKTFDTLKNLQLLSLLYDSLITKMGEHDESVFTKHLSPIQKTVFYFLQFDGETKNGGLLQYYFNGYNKNLPLLRQGLHLIKDNAMLILLARADSAYQKNIKFFNSLASVNDFTALAQKLPFLRHTLTGDYYKIAEKSIALLVQEIRKNPDAAVRLK